MTKTLATVGLAVHRPVLSRQIGLLFPTACGCGADTAGWAKWEEHKTRAVLAAVLPAHDRRVKAETLRKMADEIDRGPTFPLPPSVISALLREQADAEGSEAQRRLVIASQGRCPDCEIENGADDE